MGRSVYEPERGEVLFFEDEQSLYIDYDGRVRVLCEADRGNVFGSFLPSQSDQTWLLSRLLLTLPLIELLRRRQRWSVHAACVSTGCGGLLVAGTSGCGKSTLALALVRAGCDFLSDDLVFLARRNGDLNGLAFPEPVDVTDDTIRLLPELRPLLDTPPRAGWPKRQVPVEQVYGASIERECRPLMLVIPRIGDGVGSRLQPMAMRDALLELAPNVLLTDPATSQAHLRVLAELAGGVACYRLETGSDLAAAAELLRSALLSAGQA
ncbi:MAG: hypothetical protein ABR583_14645 [Gaiellaceae bacterium]